MSVRSGRFFVCFFRVKKTRGGFVYMRGFEFSRDVDFFGGVVAV